MSKLYVSLIAIVLLYFDNCIVLVCMHPRHVALQKYNFFNQHSLTVDVVLEAFRLWGKIFKDQNKLCDREYNPLKWKTHIFICAIQSMGLLAQIFLILSLGTACRCSQCFHYYQRSMLHFSTIAMSFQHLPSTNMYL